MKPMFSAVAHSPARMRSPSFSLLSSSVTTIGLPAFRASIAARIDSLPNCACCAMREQPRGGEGCCACCAERAAHSRGGTNVEDTRELP
eukprot:scaffold244771_cov26-Tisochrysis_lutea.AAC.3